MKSLPLIFCALLAGCAAPKWNGAYLGIQRVTPIETFGRGYEPDNGSAYLNAIWTSGRWSFQVEPIIPFNGGPPLLRLATDFKLF